MTEPPPSAPPDGPDAPAFRNTIKSAPRIGNVYWCTFPADARAPEFWKRRPVVVVSPTNTLLGPVLVVPITTKPQGGNPWAHALSRNPIPRERVASSAICDHLYTVSCSRLTQDRGEVPKLDDVDLQAILRLARSRIASPRG